MQTLYLIGGEDIIERDSIEINRKAFLDAGENPSVLVFPWTTPEVDTKDKYRTIMNKYFGELGASEVNYAELFDDEKTIEDKMGKSDLIYLPGGRTEILIITVQILDSQCIVKNLLKVSRKK